MRRFDDIPDDYESVIGTWELTADEIIAFAKTWDPQPFHTDIGAAEQSPFGGLVASSAHLFAICTRLFFDHPDHIDVLAMLGKDKLRLPNPARAGTTLTYRTRCIGKRASSSRPSTGIITLADTVSDSDDSTVLAQEVTLMVARGP
ncbi:MAG: MaoC/PaaZ C-terminal domain-containing protein [Gammaproteobacteria bacterium]|nr:MaoC/PaaZ C-terminal domain-containing protein [Gammaproteobacteria bacterium]